MGPTYGADYILEILGQKWWAVRNHLALRNRQNLVLGKNNQVSLTIGQILGTAAENTGWLLRSHLCMPYFDFRETVAVQLATKKCSQINGWSCQRWLIAPWKERPSGGCERFLTHPFLIVSEQAIGSFAIV
jgi:hypothetical protein